MASCSPANRESQRFTSPNCQKRSRIAFIMMPPRATHTPPSKLPIKRLFTSSDRKQNDNELKKELDIGVSTQRLRHRVALRAVDHRIDRMVRVEALFPISRHPLQFLAGSGSGRVAFQCYRFSNLKPINCPCQEGSLAFSLIFEMPTRDR